MMRRLYVLDFDRTLADTNALNDSFVQLADNVRPGVGDNLREQMKTAERDGTSFVTLNAVRDLLEAREYEQLLEQFTHSRTQDEYLFEGAHELLDYIRAAGNAVQIVSYGDETWQELKIRTTRLADKVPFMITPHPGKSAIVLEWHQDDGTFRAPNGDTYDEVIIVDDKARAFDPWGQGLVGYWITSVDRTLASQQGITPGDVTNVHSLLEVMALEKARLGA